MKLDHVFSNRSINSFSVLHLKMKAQFCVSLLNGLCWNLQVCDGDVADLKVFSPVLWLLLTRVNYVLLCSKGRDYICERLPENGFIALEYIYKGLVEGSGDGCAYARVPVLFIWSTWSTIITTRAVRLPSRCMWAAIDPQWRFWKAQGFGSMAGGFVPNGRADRVSVLGQNWSSAHFLILH